MGGEKFEHEEVAIELEVCVEVLLFHYDAGSQTRCGVQLKRPEGRDAGDYTREFSTISQMQQVGEPGDRHGPVGRPLHAIK